MGTLQVTTWQLWGNQRKTGWMKHNKDADGPVPDRRFLRIIEDSDTFCCLSPFRSRFSKSRAGTLRCDDHDSLRTIRGVTWGESRIVRWALRFTAAPIIGKNQSDICGGGAAKYYLIANSMFAREARPLPVFTGIGGPR